MTLVGGHFKNPQTWLISTNLEARLKGIQPHKPSKLLNGELDSLLVLEALTFGGEFGKLLDSGFVILKASDFLFLGCREIFKFKLNCNRVLVDFGAGWTSTSGGLS